MAAENEMQELLGRAIADEGFRAQLFDDPRQAARAAGCVLTVEQLRALKATDLQGIAEGLDERLVKRITFSGLRPGDVNYGH